MLQARHNVADVRAVSGADAVRLPTRPAGPKRTCGVRLAGALVLAALVGSACSYAPGIDAKLPDPDASAVVLAADGTRLATLDTGVHREPVALAEMGRWLPAAVVAIEDHRFFDHPGVDVRSIGRALRQDVRSGKVVEGGSTITQQYVRNVLLTDERTLRRKVKEAVLAIEVERRWTKQQILEHYLNAVYFGDGSYGAQVAARRYFGVSAARLTLAQAATLAGLLRSPEHTNPRRDARAAVARRDQVLDAMARYQRAPIDAIEAARRSPLRLAPVERTTTAPYFVDAVRQWFLDEPTFGSTEAERAHLLYQGGVRITTTLDTSAQRAAEAAIAAALPDRVHDPAAALVSIEPTTGHVVAYVGGRGTDGPEAWAQFDLAGQARRPAGSTFKPLVLAAALERHVPLSRSYPAPAELTLHPSGGPAWTVHNHDARDYGRLDLVDATVQSVNTVYAQLMLDVGPRYGVAMATRLGAGAKLDAIPGAVLGFDPVRPLDLAQAYATLAADGVRTPAVFVTEVHDAHGKLIYRATPHHTRALDARIARTVNQTLVEVVRRGTGVAARIGRPVAGKTGTTDDYRDAWFAGSTPQRTTVVWVGFATPAPMVPPRTAERVSGATIPARIWADYSRTTLQRLPVEEFPAAPSDSATGLLPVRLPDVVGMPQAQARSILTAAGVAVTTTTRVSDQYPPSTVLAQSPTAGTEVPSGTAVELVLAISG